MNQYTKKPIDYGFVILSPDHNFGLLTCTMRSLMAYHADRPVVCATAQDATPADLKEMKTMCPKVFRGGNTITGLINKGMEKGHAEWNFIIMEGVTVRKPIQHLYSVFLQDKKDILYPIVTEYDMQGKPIRVRSSFEEATLNGILIHKETFKEVGKFTDNPLEISKLMWALEAIDKECKFKAILGARL